MILPYATETVAEPPRHRTSADDVLDAVCAYFSIDRATLLTPGRRFMQSYRRQLAMYCMRKICMLTLHEIGALFDRHHSSVAYAEKRIRGRITADVETRRDVAALRTLLRLIPSPCPTCGR